MTREQEAYNVSTWRGSHKPNNQRKSFSEGFVAGVKWADEQPESKFNISNIDAVKMILEGIVQTAEHMTSGNFAHARANIKLKAQSVLDNYITKIK